jgi:hypothetical protein
MANKQVDSTGNSGKMLKATAKAEGQKQENLCHLAPWQLGSLCIWCQVYPARPTSDYCSDTCAAQAEADNEV